MAHTNSDYYIKELTSSRAELLSVIQQVSDEDFHRPQSFNQWSLKDLLSHFITWDEVTIRCVKMVLAGKAHKIPIPKTEEVDGINAQAVDKRRHFTREQILADLNQVRQELIAQVRQLTDEQINDETAPFPLKQWLPLVYRHELDSHLPKIRAWAASISKK